MKVIGIILLLLLIIGIGGAVGLGYYLLQEADKEPPLYTIQVNGHTLYVETAITAEEWNQGLSNRPSLPQDHGMLFVSPQLTLPSFWMYQMQFPLDILWIKDGIIIEIDQHVPHPTNDDEAANLLTYRPPSAIDTVLEVNAGWTEAHEVEVGNRVVEVDDIPRQKTTQQVWGTLLRKFLDNL